MKFPNILTQDGDGFECASCEKKIQPGEDCIRVDRAKVGKNEIKEPAVKSQGYAGVFHKECI